MKILDQAKNWVEERTGLVSFFTDFLHEEIPGGTRFSYTLGSACMFLLMIQIVTGIWQLFYYVPTVDHAYSSYAYLRREVPFGWLMNGFHKWGGTLFTITVGLHALRVFIWGSYKKPRELVWFIGILLIILTALFMFSGPVLPWDKKGYWAGQVGIGIAGSVPLVGPMTQTLMQGGNEMGQLALLRMYVMHVALLPGAIALFVVLHLIAFRRNGEAGPWDEKKRQKKVGYFWPEQIFKDIVMSVLIFLLLVYLSAFYPPEFSGAADPKDTLYTPKPEWNFLFLYQLLKYLPGHLEWIGTAGVPFIIVLLFGSLPFLDKGPDRNPFKRWVVILSGFGFVAVVLWLTWLGQIYVSPLAQAELDKTKSYEQVEHMSPKDAEEAVEVANADQNITGEKLFKTLGCTECHTANGTTSSKQGPDLYTSKANNRTRAWMYTQIIAPQEHNAKTIMPPYSHLSDKNVNLLLNYLEGLTPKQEPVTPAAVVAAVDPSGNALSGEAQGQQVFNALACAQCHDIRGRKSFKAGPDLMASMIKEKRDKEWLKTQIMTPQVHNPTSIMPSFANRVQEPQLNSLVEFIKSLETRTPEAAPAGGEESGATTDRTAVGKSTSIVGNFEHGKIIYNQQCLMCHGPHGNPKAKGFKAEKGVPALNPIPENFYSKDVQTFINRIDIFIQHGSPNPEGGLNMPNFGDSNTMTQEQIADVESYILHLNGVERAKLINPGIDPKEFFFTILAIAPLLFLLPGLYWFALRYMKK